MGGPDAAASATGEARRAWLEKLQRAAQRAHDELGDPSDPIVKGLTSDLDQLVARGFVEAVGEERGIAGGNRTILAVTPLGRQRLRSWLATPVEHARDLRSELLLKLVLSAPSGVDTAPLLAAQRELAAALERSLREQLRGDPDDLVLRWRTETAGAALRFIESVIAP